MGLEGTHLQIGGPHQGPLSSGFRRRRCPVGRDGQQSLPVVAVDLPGCVGYYQMESRQALRGDGTLIRTLVKADRESD